MANLTPPHPPSPVKNLLPLHCLWRVILQKKMAQLQEESRILSQRNKQWLIYSLNKQLSMADKGIYKTVLDLYLNDYCI